MAKGRELASSEDWKRFRMHKDTLELPTGKYVTAQQILILTGVALLELGAEPDLIIASKLMRYVRALCKIKKIINKFQTKNGLIVPLISGKPIY